MKTRVLAFIFVQSLGSIALAGAKSLDLSLDHSRETSARTADRAADSSADFSKVKPPAGKPEPLPGLGSCPPPSTAATPPSERHDGGNPHAVVSDSPGSGFTSTTECFTTTVKPQ